MATKLLFPKIANAIQKCRPEEQRELLVQLPHLLNLDLGDFALLKIAEDSFDFWNNPDDTLYDNL